MDRLDIRALHQDVAGKIREMIRKGALVRGQRIIEAELCEQIGVSRTPLREALRVLESEGLVELTPHKGVHIRQPSMNEIQEMFEVMGVLEGNLRAADRPKDDHRRVSQNRTAPQKA